MTINSTQKYQGYVLTSIATALAKFPGLSLRTISGKDRSAFSVECSLSGAESPFVIGVYIKISNARRSPWKYTFQRKHQEAVEMLNGVSDRTYVVFVNDDDGVACVDYDGLKELLDDHFEDTEWVSVSRKLNESYRLSGKDGLLSGKTKRSAFPGTIVDAVSQALCLSPHS